MSQPLFVYFEIVHPSCVSRLGKLWGWEWEWEWEWKGRQSFGIVGYMRICDGITSIISRGIC